MTRRGGGRRRLQGEIFGKPGTENSWYCMMRRCGLLGPTYRKSSSYEGVTVCERWRNFDNFYADMGDRPPWSDLGRIDHGRGYEPGNCRWESVLDKCRGKRNGKIIEAFGESLQVCEWSERYHIPSSVIYGRLRLGWSVEDAISKPVAILPSCKSRRDRLCEEILAAIPTLRFVCKAELCRALGIGRRKLDHALAQLARENKFHYAGRCAGGFVQQGDSDRAVDS